MLQLIKKDLLVGLKVKSIRIFIFTFIVGLFLLNGFSFIFPTILPIIITYIVVMNSFYYDSLNNSESYILSMPNKREDVVYSKYILVLLVLFISNVLMFILFGTNMLKPSRVMVLQDVVVSSLIILYSFSIIIPMIFNYRYKGLRMLFPFITILCGYLTVSNSTINEFINNGKESLLISISREIGASIYGIFEFPNYDFKVVSANIYIILLFIIAIVIFLISMKISLTVYLKRDIR
ncbi:MAG: ABC-2 transporter permease [Clostridium sp.]|uniref:ABC-2 transporter permease n=1 Tax=Clostridium sp. TaxID=1506 RepID=UPI0025C28F5B|nr:ABC-2 transporter permease [Clostridium sp.]MCF0148581.1 ABC-2 transporter permease [Clostridium sp.]